MTGPMETINEKHKGMHQCHKNIHSTCHRWLTKSMIQSQRQAPSPGSYSGSATVARVPYGTTSVETYHPLHCEIATFSQVFNRSQGSKSFETEALRALHALLHHYMTCHDFRLRPRSQPAIFARKLGVKRPRSRVNMDQRAILSAQTAGASSYNPTLTQDLGDNSLQQGLSLGIKAMSSDRDLFLLPAQSSHSTGIPGNHIFLEIQVKRP